MTAPDPRIAELQARIERLEERNRLMGDVIDYACGHIADASDAMDFLDAYRSDEWDEESGFVTYRQTQARAALGRGE